jgi:hypothetical protein
MPQTNCRTATILYLGLWAGVLSAQAVAPTPLRGSAVVARSDGYQLTEDMIQQALRFGQILAGAGFSPSDAATLRSELIAWFPKETAKQMEGYESIGKMVRDALKPKPSWFDLAFVRYKVWQGYGENPQAFREFQNVPFGKMVLKYNPILVNSGGMVVTKTDVDCQFYSAALVAQAAGVAPPAQIEKDRFIQSAPSRFASLPREQQEHLRRAELRLWSLRTVFDGSIKTRAAMTADIKKNVHSSADASREARQLENDTEHDGKYWQSYLGEGMNGVFSASRVNGDIIWLGGEMQRSSRNQQSFGKP